jgi:hypothetical protein
MVTTHNPKDTYYLGLGHLLIGTRSLLSSPSWIEGEKITPIPNLWSMHF